MAQTLASGPEAAHDQLLDQVRSTLESASVDQKMKAPVRRSATKALSWLDQSDLSARPGAERDEGAVRTVHNLRSVLGSIAGGLEDTNRHDQAVQTRRTARHLGRRFGIATEASNAAVSLAAEAISGARRPAPSQAISRLGGRP